MKKLLCMLCVCIAGVASSGAQTREALEDSVILGSISRHMIDMAFDTDKMNTDDRLKVHWTYAELMKKVSREHLAAFSDQELREVLEYLHSDAFRFLSSETFYTVFFENIEKAFQSELGDGLRFSYTIRDRAYGANLKPIYQNTMDFISPMVEDAIGEDGKKISSARRAGIPSGYIDLMKSCGRTVREHLYDIYRISALDFLSKETVKVAEDFAVSPLGQKYYVYVQNARNAADISSDEFVKSFLSDLEEKTINTMQLRSSVSEYVSLSRAFPEYLPDYFRPYAEVALGNAMYQGETRDRSPYGKGKMTDRKGVVYEGNFKNGQRHGLITVTKPGKEAVSQYWVADKYRKDIPAGLDKKGAVPAPFVEEGIKYGYAAFYDNERKSRQQGVFVDGQLTGTAKVSEPGRVLEGEFVDGRFSKGVITWTNDDTQSVTFNGRMSVDLAEGVREWVAKDDSRKETQTGYFKEWLLEGDAYKVVAAPGDSLETSGVFAYGKQYGKGEQKRNIVYYGSGVHESSVYVGEFYDDKYHGKGRLTMSLSNIGAANGTFTRCGILMPEFAADEMDVTIEGTFDNGTLKEGLISYSDGSWFEGKFSELGLMQGQMLCNYKDGSVYQGGCLDGNHHGKGELYRANGTVFKGEFLYGDPVIPEKPEPVNQRRANVIRNDQLKYEYNNLATGYGKATLIKPAGVKIMVRTNSPSLKVDCIGRFVGDIMIEGMVSMSDGNWLEGVFQDGILIEGKGKIVDKSWVVYEGDIKNGYPHGSGVCFYSDGTWFEGQFAWGNRMGGTHYSATGDVIKVYE